MITVAQIEESKLKVVDSTNYLEEVCDAMTTGLKRMGEALRYFKRHRTCSPTPRKRRGGKSRKKMGWT